MDLSGNEFSIELPCGYSTYFKYLKNQPPKFLCTMCGKHFIDKESCFNEPKNRLLIKQNELSNEIVKYNNLKKYFDRIKSDPDMYVDKTFEKLEFNISQRCTELKEKFCKQIDDYYLDIVDRIVKEKKAIAHEFESNYMKCELPSADDLKSLENSTSDVIDQVNRKLDECKESSSIITGIIKDISVGENFQLEDPNEINVHDFFGKIYASKKNSKSDDNNKTDANTKYHCHKGFYGHTDKVKQITLLGNDRILSVSFDQTVNLWDKENAKVLTTFIGHTDSILSICLMNNQFFATGSKDETIKIWNTGNKFSLKTLTGHTGAVICLRVLKNGEIISGSDDKTIKVWAKSVKTLFGHEGSVNCLDENYNGLIVSGSSDCSIKTWNALTQKCLSTLNGHKGEIMDMKILGNDFLASASLDKTVKIWNIKNSNCSKTLVGHLDSIQQIDKLEKDKLVSCSLDGSIKIWNIDSGNCISTIEAHFRPIICLKVSDKGELLTGSIDGSLYVWSKF
ncbi:ribosome assembly 4 (RSA4) [Brachionus plicatilis]|uniref:Ribosome assembly 4 (RSA4) n=1 Tax=Brachionus plicatilis TaxID=10195 RepID=A0A3M7T7T1_BRAPC|nr:ribosome assembly 4 (RSA4) [Brachionus plicatilis]